MKIIIDGENFRHQIASILVDAKLLDASERNNYFCFDIIGFFKDILDDSSIEITYYTTKIKQPNFKIPKKLSDKLDVIASENRKWIAHISNQGIKIIKAGHLRIRESNSCIHCSKKTLVLQEKGVDVRVATDLLLYSANNQSVGLVSSDSDIVPALQAATRFSNTVTYICPSNNLNRSLASLADQVITFDKKRVMAYFKKDTK